MSGPAPRPVRLASLTPASAIQIEPVHWLWEDRIALGTLCLLGGREGVGKSLVTYTLAAQITRGQLPGVFEGLPRSVIIAASEDSWEHTIVPRLLGAGADLQRVFRLDVTATDGAASLSLPIDLAELERVTVSVNAALIVLDPLLSRVSSDLDTYKDADVRLALEPIVLMAKRARASLLGLIHVNKSATADPLTMLMGSRAFAAVARLVLFVMVDPNDSTTRLLGQAKNNLGRMDLPSLSFAILPTLVATLPTGEVWSARVDWRGEGALSLHDALQASTVTAEDQTDRTEAQTWLLDYLEAAGGPVDSVKVKRAAQQAGYAVRTIQRARSALAVVVTEAGFPRKSYWALPLALNGNGNRNSPHRDDWVV